MKTDVSMSVLVEEKKTKNNRAFLTFLFLEVIGQTVIFKHSKIPTHWKKEVEIKNTFGKRPITQQPDAASVKLSQGLAHICSQTNANNF